MECLAAYIERAKLAGNQNEIYSKQFMLTNRKDLFMFLCRTREAMRASRSQLKRVIAC